MSEWVLPDQGVVFWPVGNGDAVTVVVDEETVIQVDIHHPKEADEDDDDRVPVVDRLVEVLPKADNADKPKLSALAITHHDVDHISGFERLIEEIQVGEMWITLRSFVEEKEEPEGLTEVGQAVYDEACRRRDLEIDAAAEGGRAASGDRLRVIGNASVLDDPDWDGFPVGLLSSAGEYIPDVNGEDKTDKVEIFVHTPFRSDTEGGDRNSSSLGMQVTLKSEECEIRVLLLGDLGHEQIEAFFEKSQERGNEDRLIWDVLLGPHHCSRGAVRKEVDGEWVDAESATYFTDVASEGAKVVVSSRQFGEASGGDTDPPHDDARTVYEGIVGDEFYCTADYAVGSDGDPLTVAVLAGECGEIQESSAERAARWRSVGTVRDSAVIAPGEEYIRGGDRPYA